MKAIFLLQALVLLNLFNTEVRAGKVDGWAPMLAAQIQVESAWRPDVSSPYAHGLAQFTKPTYGDVAPLTVASCADVSIFDPSCSIRAQIVYMRKLLYRYRYSASVKDQWAFAWAAYNGGAGWISREKRRCKQATDCDPRRYWNHVERHCIRAQWACKENRSYPRKILKAMARSEKRQL